MEDRPSFSTFCTSFAPSVLLMFMVHNDVRLKLKRVLFQLSSPTPRPPPQKFALGPQEHGKKISRDHVLCSPRGLPFITVERSKVFGPLRWDCVAEICPRSPRTSCTEKGKVQTICASRATVTKGQAETVNTAALVGHTVRPAVWNVVRARTAPGRPCRKTWRERWMPLARGWQGMRSVHLSLSTSTSTSRSSQALCQVKVSTHAHVTPVCNATCPCTCAASGNLLPPLGIKNTFGVTFGRASATMLDAAQHKGEDLDFAYSPTSRVRRLQCSKSLVGGPMMSGLMEPYSRSPSRLEPLAHTRTGTPLSPFRKSAKIDGQNGERDLHTHLQGSAVDKDAYYETLVGTGYEGLRVKTGWDPKRTGPPSVAVGAGNPHRNYSAISQGDRFYFNGPHMFQSTYAESSQTGLARPNASRLSQQQGTKRLANGLCVV